MSLLVTAGILTKKPPTCSAVIAAAGSARRCKGEDKLLYKINGTPVLAYTIEAFEKSDCVREIIVVTKKDLLETIEAMCKERGYAKVTKIIVGGEQRAESVLNGVFAVQSRTKYIAIHDGARPCVTTTLIEKTHRKAVKHQAAAPGLPVNSTIKRERGGTPPSALIISETIDRRGLYEIQTPQIFRAELIKAGLTKAFRDRTPLTDDCLAVERLGIPVHIVEGERRNIKITWREDLEIAKALLSAVIIRE